MDVGQFKLFLKITVMLACNEKLYLEKQELICLYEECLVLAQFLEDITILTILYYLLGLLYKDLCRFEESIKFHLKYLNIAIKTGYRRGEANACRNIGNSYISLGDYNEAIKYHEKDLAIAIELNDKSLEANAYGNLGNAVFSLRRFQSAKQYYEKDLSIAIEMCDKKEEGKAYARLGNVHQALDNYREAIEFHTKALNIAIMEKDRDLEGKTYGNLGNSYHSLAEFHKAIKYHEKDLQIAIEMCDTIGEGNAYMNLGNAFESLGRYEKAKLYHEKQLNISRKIKDRNGEKSAFASLGNVYQSLGNYNKSIDYYKKSLSIAKENSDKMAEGKCYGNLGNSYLLLGKYQEAITYHEKCLAITIDICDRSGEGECYGYLGNVFQSLGEYHKAVEYYEKNLNIAREIGNQQQEAYAYGNIGNAHQSLGEYEKAITYHQKYLDIAMKIGNQHAKANAYGDLGNSYQSLGEYNKAIEYYEKKLSITIKIGDRRGEGNAYGNLGNAKNSLGKYLEAIKYHSKHLNIAIETNNRSGEVNAYGSLGNDYFSLGNYSEAIKNYEKCLSIALDIGDKNGESNAYGNLGNIYQSSRKFDKAIENYEKALNIAEQLGDKYGEGTAYGNLGISCCSLGKFDQALEYYKKHLAIALKIGDRNGEGNYYGNIGNVHRLLGNTHDAINYLKQCLHIAKEIGDKKREGFAYTYIGLCFYQLSYRYKEKDDEANDEVCVNESSNYLKKSILCYETLFDELEEQDQFKISIVDTFIMAYRLLTMVYIETEQVQEALLVTERGRARALGDILMARYCASSKLAPGSRRQLEYCDIATIISLRDFCVLFYALEKAYVATWVLTDQTPLYFVGRKIKGFEPSIDDQFSGIDNGNLLVKCITETVHNAHDYMKVREEVICENRSIEQHQSSYDDHVERDTPGTNESTEGHSNERCIYDEDEFDINPLEVLFDIFVAPVQHCLKQNEIVIIPEGPLFKVPFAALRDPQTGLFLSENMRIRISPSLTTLKILQESAGDYHCKGGALIIGNPDVGDVMYRGQKTTFKHLSFAKQEAEEIAKLLGVEAFTGSKAKKGVIKQRLQEGVAVIHFATHGSEIGEIILAPSVSNEQNSFPEEDDYILTTREAQESGIRAQLVVLSCCHSGRGEIRSEGVVGMSRAFIAAGARAVVASLWAIDDEATKVFMLKFYSHLKKGESASESLQQAMKEMREQGQYREPKYWAPFVLIGDNVTVSL